MAACRMSDTYHQHIPVLLHEAILPLVQSPSGIYIDATFGRGSHSKAILDRLNADGQLIAFDKDLEAVQYAKNQLAHDKRFSIHHASFTHLQSVLTTLQLDGQISGILFDLGVSSPQLDNPARGFSFSKSGALDMRMDTTQGIDAMTWLANVDEKALADVLWQYGEEKFSRRIARAIVETRKTTPITTTDALAGIIRRAMPRMKKQEKHPATRSFQAIRIAVNQELQELEEALSQSLEVLSIGGRLAVISFHSLEDRIVKQFIQLHEKGRALPRGLPIKATHFQSRLKAIGKPIKPGEQEVNINPRARSAILRIAEKQS